VTIGTRSAGILRSVTTTNPMRPSPLVSVIIPTYYRRDVVDAVESAVSQTYENVEVIVVDDSGEGYAAQWINSREDLLYVQLRTNQGANSARRVGFERSSGDFVHFLDDDDRLKPGKIEKSVETMRGRDDLAVVYSGVEFDEESQYPDPDCRGEVLRDALEFEMWPCMTSTMLIRRTAIEQSEVFLKLPGGDDLQMMIELAIFGEFEFVDEILVEKGRSPDARGASKGAIEGRLEIIRKYSELYKEHPNEVQQKALSETEFTKAKYYLENRIWSLAAVTSMIRHCQANPDPGILCPVKILASVFGRPGWKLSNRVRDQILT